MLSEDEEKVVEEESEDNRLDIMRRINLHRQGRGRRHSCAMSTDDNAVYANLDKQDVQPIIG